MSLSYKETIIEPHPNTVTNPRLFPPPQPWRSRSRLTHGPPKGGHYVFRRTRRTLRLQENELITRPPEGGHYVSRGVDGRRRGFVTLPGADIRDATRVRHKPPRVTAGIQDEFEHAMEAPDDVAVDVNAHG